MLLSKHCFQNKDDILVFMCPKHENSASGVPLGSVLGPVLFISVASWTYNNNSNDDCQLYVREKTHKCIFLLHCH